MTDNPRPTLPFALRDTNRSNPSIVYRKGSQQSITASEDYYSLSSSSRFSRSNERLSNEGRRSTNSIHRYQTPPSRYRTPAQSTNDLSEDTGATRKTPMRGQGRRRAQSASSGIVEERSAAGAASAAYPPPHSSHTAAAGPPQLRSEGVRRKPVPSTVIESPGSESPISAINARSSMAQAIDRGNSPPTPGVDDTPYLRFAIDQLTRDEDVRGSRRYPGASQYRGLGSGVDGNYPYLLPGEASALYDSAEKEVRTEDPSVIESRKAEGLRPPVSRLHQRQLSDPPPRNPRRNTLGEDIDNESGQASYVDPKEAGLLRSGTGPLEGRRQQIPQLQQRGDAGVFVPLSPTDPAAIHQPPLSFLPGILRPLALLVFILLLVLFITALVFTAAWSIINTGIWDYGTFGDGRYFVFQHLPTLLGMILYFWLIQIQAAVSRIAPFLALSSENLRSRRKGIKLPLYPGSFLLPTRVLQYFKAGQTVLGVFFVISWLQIFTIPLLASSYNVYFLGSPQTGRWRWVATQGAIWTCIALYLLLIAALVVLLLHLSSVRRKYGTGMKWDPRSLADLVALLERSNALDASEEQEEPAKLGYWNTSGRRQETFHTYGAANRQTRRYSLEDGRIREKPHRPTQSGDSANTANADPEKGRSWDQRHSSEPLNPSSTHPTEHLPGLPWFLKLSAAALWAIIAIVLLLAFLIVSYLPSTRVSAGFAPGAGVPAPVNRMGFSATNFLYGFLSALLGMLCLLFWLEIDYAYRRLQAFSALRKQDGELAERSLLLSYPADLPGLVTIRAAINGHWRVALLSFTSLIAATLPVLGGGVFWAQFYVPTQTVRVSAHMPAFYALSVFLTLYALSYLAIFPTRIERAGGIDRDAGERFVAPTTFQHILVLLRHSRLLDDVAFHAPESKTQLVTRLLSAPAGSRISQHEEAAQSKVSLADSVRGFGRARQQAIGGLGIMETPKYFIGRVGGRDGRETFGLDRTRS